MKTLAKFFTKPSGHTDSSDERASGSTAAADESLFKCLNRDFGYRRLTRGSVDTDVDDDDDDDVDDDAGSISDLLRLKLFYFPNRNGPFPQY